MKIHNAIPSDLIAPCGMSMIDNLMMISESGIRDFVRKEKEKWTCPECGELLCVHRPACLNCGHEWLN